jgi:hypothetical protein
MEFLKREKTCPEKNPQSEERTNKQVNSHVMKVWEMNPGHSDERLTATASMFAIIQSNIFLTKIIIADFLISYHRTVHF